MIRKELSRLKWFQKDDDASRVGRQYGLFYILHTYLPIFHRVYGLSKNIYPRYPLPRILDQNFLLLLVSEGNKSCENFSAMRLAGNIGVCGILIRTCTRSNVTLKGNLQI